MLEIFLINQFFIKSEVAEYQQLKTNQFASYMVKIFAFLKFNYERLVILRTNQMFCVYASDYGTVFLCAGIASTILGFVFLGKCFVLDSEIVFVVLF